MKSKIAIASAFLTLTSASMGEIVINEFLSFEGFVDMAYTHFDGEAGDFNESDNSFGIEEVEVSFLFDFNPVTALIDFEYEENGEDLEVEQAFITYTFDEGKLKNSSIDAGRYASMLGFEAYERVGRYQFSTAYESAVLGSALNSGVFNGNLSSDSFAYFESVLIPVGERYSQGVRYVYEDEKMLLAASLQDGTLNYENRLGGNDGPTDTAVDDGGYGFELAFAYDCGSGMTYFLGGSYEMGDGLNDGAFSTGDTETFIINTYATYETGAWLFAAEINYGDTDMDDITTLGDGSIESLTGLIMTNYAYNAQASVTGRISYIDLSADFSDNSDNEADAFKFTVAHNYAFTDNLLLVGELSYLGGEFDSDLDSGDDWEELSAAVQLLFTF